MRLIFAGTPVFAAQALEALIAAGHEIALVLTQPDRPAGRGMKLTASAVKEVALRHGLTVYQPLTLKDAAAQAVLREARAEVMIVAAYGLILPQAALDIPVRGCINIHASLLPRWRGAAPIQRAILAGDAETGITLMQMDAGLDTGAMLSVHPLTIGPHETAGELHDRLATLGATAIVALLSRLDAVRGVAQDASMATYAAKIDKTQARVDWSQTAETVLRQVRAFNPAPGAWTEQAGQPLKIWRAERVDGVQAAAMAAAAGQILQAGEAGMVVACGTGAICILEIQAAGAKRLSTTAFLVGHPLTVESLLS
ncbi:MAG: methionyl-tRNA formyltransferase [Betaproteobacteria bacterium]|jgi:methionyl-tRNA formyltransferase|nr:MAG: methionyl-tRNA formyltransferase [Betaproteobacteria bacterium]